MSNPVSRIDLNDTEAAFLARTGPTGEANSNLIQQKQDKAGSTITEGDSRTRDIAAWKNMFDDFMLEWFRTGGGGAVPQKVKLTTPEAVPTVGDTVTPADDTIVRIVWRVVGRVNGDNDNAIYGTWTARYINDGGAVTLWVTESFTAADFSPAGTLTTALTSVNISGGDIEITVRGEGGTAIDWEIDRTVEVFFK